MTGVAFADGRPPNNVDNFNNFDLEDSPTPPGQSQPVTPWVAVTPEYFRALGLKLLEGRLFDERDALRPDLETVVVDRAWARRFFPGASAIGKRLHEGGCTSCPWTTVVGIVSEVKYAGLDQPDRDRLQAAGADLAVPLSRAADDGRSGGVARRRSGRSCTSSTPRCRSRASPPWTSSWLGRWRAALAVDARRRVRGDRAAALGRRHLRRDGVLRPAARQGHQHPHGARRPSARRAPARARSGHGCGGERSRRRPAGRAGVDAAGVAPAVRRRHQRREDVRGRRRPHAGGLARGLLGAGPARGLDAARRRAPER